MVDGCSLEENESNLRSIRELGSTQSLHIWKQIWRRNSTNFPTSTNDIFLTKLIGTSKLWQETNVSTIFDLKFTYILTEVPLLTPIFVCENETVYYF